MTILQAIFLGLVQGLIDRRRERLAMSAPGGALPAGAGAPPTTMPAAAPLTPHPVPERRTHRPMALSDLRFTLSKNRFSPMTQRSRIAMASL